VGKLDVNRRQLDILELVREVFDCMATAFVGARSGLGTLSAFAARVREGEPFRSLCDLLRYDESLATLNLKVGVGADGRIRGFEILSVSQNDQNPFVSSAWRRWAAKVELFLRGFWFGDGEVMSRLIYAVFDGIQDDLVPLVQLVGDLEFYLGGLGFHDMAQRPGLSLCLPLVVEPGSPSPPSSMASGPTMSGLAGSSWARRRVRRSSCSARAGMWTRPGYRRPGAPSTPPVSTAARWRWISSPTSRRAGSRSAP
jgi:hypothetical protein